VVGAPAVGQHEPWRRSLASTISALHEEFDTGPRKARHARRTSVEREYDEALATMREHPLLKQLEEFGRARRELRRTDSADSSFVVGRSSSSHLGR
jgi:hypothetical protein